MLKLENKKNNSNFVGSGKVLTDKLQILNCHSELVSESQDLAITTSGSLIPPRDDEERIYFFISYYLTTTLLLILVNLFIANVCFAKSNNQTTDKSLSDKKSLNCHPEFISGSQDLAIPKQVRNDATIENCRIGSKQDNSGLEASENPDKNSSNESPYTSNVETLQPVLRNSENSDVVSQEKFNKYGNQKITEILNTLPALNESYGQKGETAFYLRGFNQRQIPVLLDGVPVYVPYDGLIGLDRLNGSDVQKIKIVKSAPSIIYGPNTMGGVINITTEKPEKPFKVRLRFDDNQVNTLNQDLYIGSKPNNFYFTYNHSFSKSHGFNLPDSFNSTLNENGDIRDNSGFRNLDFSGSIGYSSNDNQDYHLSYNSLNSSWDIPPEINVSNPRYWKFSKWRKNTLIFNMRQPALKDHLFVNSAVYYDKYYNVLDSYDSNTYSSQLNGYSFHSIYDDYSVGYNFIPEIVINKYIKITPVYLYKRDIHREIPDYNEQKDKYSISTTTLGGEIELNPTSKVTINLGSSLNRYNPIYNDGNTVRDSILAWDGQGGISYFISNNNRIFFDIGRKTRFPTLKELYSGYIGRNVPNPNLKEETALRYEIGYNWTFKDSTKFNISLFRSSIDNLIANIPVENTLYQNQNVDKAAIQGIDANLDIELIKKKVFLNLGYVLTDATDKSADRTSKELSYIPKNKVFTGITLNLPFSISADINLIYVSKTHFQDNTDLKWKTLGGYPLLNFGLLKKFKERYVVFLNIQNILDNNYQTFHNYPMQGININMGTRLEI